MIKIKKKKMNRAQTRMYKMIERFEENLNNVSINEYFQVPMEIKINYEDILLATSDLAKNKCSDTIFFTINMLKETGEDWINLGLILYDFDLFNLRPEGKLELDKLVRYMKQHPDVFVELQSHTDSRGTYEYNIWLAEQRSQSCVNYIISNGISSSQIIPKGYGERRLKNSCNDFTVCTEDEHQENRRTELHIKLTKDAIIDSSNLN